MPPSAARLTPRLLEELARIDRRGLPIAEVNRRLGEKAEALGLQRPSYERVRVLVHELRSARARRGPSTAQVLLEIAMRARDPREAADVIMGWELEPLRRT